MNFARLAILIAVLDALIVGYRVPAAQDAANLVGLLRVDAPGVEVRRVNTAQWVAIKVETLVAGGDSIRANDKGRAVITFFDGILSATLQSSSELRLNSFTGKEDAFSLEIQAVRGFADFSTQRTLSDATQFRVVLPAFQATVLSGALRTRVEQDDRSAVLNISTGESGVQVKDAAALTVGQNSGYRLSTSESGQEVVPAVSFPTLDSAIDGCPTQTTVEGDVVINVRQGAGLNYKVIGGIDGKSSVQAMGITNGADWYRIRYKDGFGWIAVSRLVLDRNCAGLRRYADGVGESGAEKIAATPAPAASPTPETAATPAR